jgi:hypothetical protein
LLSATLGRPVLLDDAKLRPLAYSAQAHGIDAVRSESILGRGASAAVRRALDEQGIANAEGVMRIARVPELGMEERVCASLRDERGVLGYLWVFDPHRELDADALDRVASTARRATRVLTAVEHPSPTDERALIERLCSASAAEREHAVLEVRSRELLPDRPLVVCSIAPVELGVDAWASTHHMARRFSAGHAIAGGTFASASLLVSLDDPVLGPVHEEELAAMLHGTGDDGVAVGQSAAVGGLSEVVEGHRQSTVALRVALGQQAGATHAAWPTLGADRLVAQLPDAARADLPPQLARLLGEEPVLASTLEAFLDTGGDVKATAAALSLHRSGLYYRLRRIEELTGLRLDRGDDRLLAHLAVRLVRSS